MMEEQLPFVSILSLQQMALRKVAVVLWNEPRALVSVGNFRFTSGMPGDHLRYWHEVIESQVSEKISELQLPKSIAKQMVQVLKPIGLQMMRWKLFHEYYLMARNTFFVLPVLEKIQWTAAGTVDYRKTAEELVRCDVFDIVKRYKLACLYCLDNYIPELCKELSEDDKTNFYSQGNSCRKAWLLLCSWRYILGGEKYEVDRIYQCAFQNSSSQGNKAAAQYFLQKLSPQERENSIMRAVESALQSRSRHANTYLSSFPNTNVSDVVFYLLSEMTPEQRVQVFREKPAEVLGCFFNWPWQDAFLDFSNTLWTWMQCEDLERRRKNYDILLDKMQSSIQKSDYCLPSLYQNLFMSSPSDFKKRLVQRELVFSPLFTTFFSIRDTETIERILSNLVAEGRLRLVPSLHPNLFLSSPSDFRRYFEEQECIFVTFFMKLIVIEDAETVNVILSNLDAGDGLRLASSVHILTLFDFFISRGKRCVVESCLRGLSKEDKASLKEAFMRLKKRRDDGITKLETPTWRRFFDFLDETDARAQAKRNSDDETLVEAKKLCCEEK